MRHLSRMWRWYRPRNWMLAVLLCQLLLPALPPARLQAYATQAVSHLAETQIDVTLAIPGTPRLGEPLALEATVTPLIDAPEVRLRWGLPEGVTLLDGPPEESLGFIAAGETRTLTRHVRLDRPDTHRIGVEASFKPQPAITYGDAAILFVTVDESGGSVTDQDVKALAQLQEEIPFGVGAETIPGDPEAPADHCVTVFGSFKRQDLVFNGSNAVTTNVVPVTHAVVELWESDTFFDDHYETMFPDANGGFSWVTCHGDGWGGGEPEYYIKLVAKTEVAGETIARVYPENLGINPQPVRVYEFKTGDRNTSGVTSLNFGEMELDETKSAPFNIIEAIFDASQLWMDSDATGPHDDDVQVFWTPGLTVNQAGGTYYNSWFDNIHIGGNPSNPNQFDDTVIIHEWTHFADDKWGCDDNPGGTHTAGGHFNTRLTWGEGFPDFYQSIVRGKRGDANSEFYLDANGMSTCNVCIDFENVDSLHPDRVGDDNETAVAATLWDLVDFTNERQDKVNLDLALLIRVYRHQSDSCTLRGYFKTWALNGGPTDADVAAVITQNTSIANIFGLVASDALAQAQALQAAEAIEAGIFPIAAEGEAEGVGFIGPETATTEDYRWWERLTFIVDNSKSMEGERIDAVRDVIGNRVEVLADLEQGVEFRLDTFNNASATNTQVFAGQFYPDMFQPAINALGTIPDADAGCDVNAFPALQQAVAGQTGVDAWLFTDNYPAPTASPIEAMRAELATRDVRATFALLQAPGGISCFSPGPVDVNRQLQFQRQLLFAGSPSPTEPAHSIVPYLLTALATGGQFFFVDEENLDDAARILQAQINRSAGAGRWSDYVSNQTTYRFDRLAPSEYEWIPADLIGTSAGTPGGTGSEGFVDVTLPSAFTFYGRETTAAHVYENGYITLGDEFGEAPDNTPIPNAAAPNGALYTNWDNLEWGFIFLAEGAAAEGPAAEEAAPEVLPVGTILPAQQEDWFVIQHHGFDSSHSNCEVNQRCDVFQTLLNLETGEIRYQYHTLSGSVLSATIGLESWGDFNPVSAVQVSHNNPDGAESGMGYRFWPVPPQPLKSYSVTVDATMQSIGFLLTGFDGTLAPMVVRMPNGSVLDCNASGVLCIPLGNVQYVQANVGPGRVGRWTIEVTPGASGAGTFAFSSMAAGPLPAVSPTDRTRPAFATSVFLIDMGRPVDGNQLDAHFRTPGDLPFGAAFAMHDDGNHGDGAATDGLFGSSPINPDATGSAYLWVEGELNGDSFTRMDTKLFSFQPLRLTAPAALTALDAQNPFNVRIFNDDTVTHTYELLFQAPEGWRVDVGAGGNISFSVVAGQSLLVPLLVSVGISDTAALAVPSGVGGLLNIAVLEVEQGAMYDSASVQVTRKRRVNQVEIYNPYEALSTGNTPVYLQVGAFDNTGALDETGAPVADGTRINLTTSLGTISPTVFLQGGWADVRFVPGNQIGTAEITASSLNGKTDTTEIVIENPRGDSIALVSTETNLPSDGKATAKLTATVRDRLGNAVENQRVRIGVEGDDNQFGTINGSEVITGMTNANGNLVVTFTAGGIIGGTAGIRAELLRGSDPIDAARIEIVLTRKLYVPFISR